MRRIDKGQAPQIFSSFVKSNSPREWSELPAEIRSECRRHILEEEQHGLSAYTERPLGFGQENLHIDHYRKRDLFRKLTFSWGNLLVDEHNPNYGADYKDGRNGVHTSADYDKLVDPVTDDAASFFEYLFDGTIVARDDADKERADYTIDVLNLNHSALKRERWNVINHIRLMKSGGMSAAQIRECLDENPFQGYLSVVEFFCKSPAFEMLSMSNKS